MTESSNMLSEFESLFETEISKIVVEDDPAHDLLHFKRVVKLARELAKTEKAQLEVVIPAAWLHDYVVIAKNDPRRAEASKLSAIEARRFLTSIEYPTQSIEGIAHAIESHSFSANIEVKTVEAAVVQDADRLDGLGAIGIARCFTVGGQLKRPFYEAADPFCAKRQPEDAVYTIDHFYKKLFKTAATMKTNAGKVEAEKRLRFMDSFINQLQSEI